MNKIIEELEQKVRNISDTIENIGEGGIVSTMSATALKIDMKQYEKAISILKDAKDHDSPAKASRSWSGWILDDPIKKEENEYVTAELKNDMIASIGIVRKMILEEGNTADSIITWEQHSISLATLDILLKNMK